MPTLIDAPPGTDFDVLALGARIRALRLALGLTVDALGRRSGVSRTMVAAVEGGEKAPTVLTLHRIATGLNTTMTRLLGDEMTGDVALLRRDAQPVARDPSGWERRTLAPPSADAAFEFMRTTIPPGVDAGTFPPHPRGARESVAVEAGALTLTVAGAAWRLATGDCLTYAADVAHGFRNDGEADCVYYLVVHRPAPAAGEERSDR